MGCRCKKYLTYIIKHFPIHYSVWFVCLKKKNNQTEWFISQRDEKEKEILFKMENNSLLFVELTNFFSLSLCLYVSPSLSLFRYPSLSIYLSIYLAICLSQQLETCHKHKVCSTERLKNKICYVPTNVFIHSKYLTLVVLVVVLTDFYFEALSPEL